MKYLPNILGALLGLAFIAFSVLFFLMKEMPPLPPGSPQDHFAQAFGPTGYFHFVKVLELIGGILLIIPKTRNFGLLVLGPIIINILAYHAFVGRDLAGNLVVLGPIAVIAAYLLWVARKQFAGLLN